MEQAVVVKTEIIIQRFSRLATVVKFIAVSLIPTRNSAEVRFVGN